MPKRVDAEDVGDIARHTLHRAEAEGFVVENVEFRIEWTTKNSAKRRMPIGATLTIKLVPSTAK